MSNKTESVVVNTSKAEIENVLSFFDFKDVSVVGSRITEDGYELVLEGRDKHVDHLVWFWSRLPIWEAEAHDSL